MFCPLHRCQKPFDGDCPQCEEANIVAMSVEYDKQDRVRDTMLYMGHTFDPYLSRALMVFTKPSEKEPHASR